MNGFWAPGSPPGGRGAAGGRPAPARQPGRPAAPGRARGDRSGMLIMRTTARPPHHGGAAP